MTPLVLVHAFPLHSGMWDAVRPALGEVADLHTPELPGWGGRRPLEVEPSVDALADDLADQLATRGLDRVVLGGLSLGGYVVMAFLRRHPGRVRAVMLADTKAAPDAPPQRESRLKVARTVLEERSPRVLLDDLVPTVLGATTREQRPDVVAAVNDLVAQAEPEAVAWTQRALAERPDSFDVLRALDVPLLVVVGDEDALSPPAEARAMVDAAPDARLVVIPGAGHLTAMEVPAEFTAAVTDFLAELPGS